eukprot:TRINITY_DN12043_c0_g1_i1.p1 TRINITY_DN12043_c0_g1~~TRINITY_DN12043_c0_g1_i1.p1  ORF type:complete len:1914 (+),score=759.69 TRINITY_DN12043_c0_g1_i1:443-5743(+)
MAGRAETSLSRASSVKSYGFASAEAAGAKGKSEGETTNGNADKSAMKANASLKSGRSRRSSVSRRLDAPDGKYLVGYLVNQVDQLETKLTGDDNGDKMDLTAEFAQVTEAEVKHTTVAAQREVNQDKHRHSNIRAFDHTRVKVTPDGLLNPPLTDPASSDVDTDYINANYLDGHELPQAYIATQSPLPRTMNAFWRMVFDEGSTVIVMLTKEMENGRLKAHRYWPEDNQSGSSTITYSDVTVTLTGTSDNGKWVRRSLTLHRNGIERKLEQYALTAWPDKGVPDEPDTLLALRKEVNAHAKQTGAPIIVHCSSGVGRTGTFVALDRLLTAAACQHTPLSVQDTVAELRNQRMLMVHTPEQYAFLYRALHRGLEQELARVRAETTSRERVNSSRRVELPSSAATTPTAGKRPGPAGADLHQSTTTPIASGGKGMTAHAPVAMDRLDTGSVSSSASTSLTTARRRASMNLDDATLLSQGPAPPLTNEEQLHNLNRRALKKWPKEDVGSFFQYLGMPTQANLCYRHEITGSQLHKQPERALQLLELNRAAEREYVLSALQAAHKDKPKLLDEHTRNATIAQYRHKHPLSAYEAREEPAPALDVVSGQRVVRVKTDRVSTAVQQVAIAVGDESTVVELVRRLLDHCLLFQAKAWQHELMLHTPDGDQAVTDGVLVGGSTVVGDGADKDAADDNDDEAAEAQAAVTTTLNSCLKQLARAAARRRPMQPPDTWLELRQLNHSKHLDHTLVRSEGQGVHSRFLRVPVTAGCNAAAVVSAVLARLGKMEAASDYGLTVVDLLQPAGEDDVGVLAPTARLLTVQGKWRSKDCKCFQLVKLDGEQASSAPLDLPSVLAERNRLMADVTSLQSQLETAQGWAKELNALKADLENTDQMQTLQQLEQQQATLNEANDEIENLRQQLAALKSGQPQDSEEATTAVAVNTIARYEKTIQQLEDELEAASASFLERTRDLEQSRQELEGLCFDRASDRTEDSTGVAKASLEALQASLAQRSQALAESREAEREALRKAWELQSRLLVGDESSVAMDAELAEMEAQVVKERAALKAQVDELREQLEAAQASSSGAVVVPAKPVDAIATPLLFDVVQDALLVAVEVDKGQGSIGLSLVDTKQQVGGRRQATVTVKSVVEGSPADEAGLRAGDKILSVDETDLLGKDKQAALTAVRNGHGILQLLVARPGGLDMTMSFYEDETAAHNDQPEHEVHQTTDDDAGRLQQELVSVQRKLKEREREAEGLRARHRTLLEENDDQREQLERFSREHRKIAAELGEQAEEGKPTDLGGQLKELREEREQALLDGEKLKAKVSQLKRDLKKRGKELASVHAQLKQEQEAAKASTATSLSAELDETKSASRDLHAKIKRLEEELHSKTKSHEMLKASSSATEETLQGMTGAMRELRDRNLELERQLEQGNAGAGVAAVGPSKKEQALREQLSAVRSKHQKEMLELKKQLRALKAADKANSKKQAADKSSAGSDLKALEKSMSEAQAQLKKEIDAHAALTVKHDKMRGQLEELRKEHKAVNEKLKLANTGKQQAEAAMEATVASLDANLTATTEELTRVRNALKQERAAKQALEEKVAGGDKAAQKQKEEYQKAMTQKVTKLEADNEELTMTKNNLASQLEKLEKQLESKETMIMAMEAERDHVVGVLRDELSGQDEEKVKKKMEPRAVQESDELWDIIESKSKTEILDMLLDRDEETERLRQYVDNVTTVVMMQAPQLFEEIGKANGQDKQVGTLRQSRQRSMRKRSSTIAN